MTTTDTAAVQFAGGVDRWYETSEYFVGGKEEDKDNGIEIEGGHDGMDGDIGSWLQLRGEFIGLIKSTIPKVGIVTPHSQVAFK